MTIADLGLRIDSSDGRTAIVDLDRLVGAAHRAEAATTSLGTAAERAFAKTGASTRNAIDGAAKAADTLRTASERAGVSLGSYERGLIGAGRANDNFSVSAKAARANLSNLQAQILDIGVSLQGGQNPFLVMTQQGAQVLPILGQMGIGGALKGLISPLVSVGGAAAAGAVGLGVAAKAAWDYSEGQDAIARALAGTGRLSGATVAGINATAEASADAAKVSVGSAREMVTAFAATGKIGPAMFGDLTLAAARYARMTGMDVPSATAKMAEALGGDVSRGVLDLNKGIGFLSGSTLELIERQIAMGDRTGAQKTAIDAMKTSLNGATESTNAWTMALEGALRGAKNLYDQTGRGVLSIVAPTQLQQLQSLTTRYAGAQAAALASGNANAALPGDPDHIRFMRQNGYTEAQIRAELNPGQPGSLGDREMNEAARAAEKLADELTNLQENIRRQGAAGMVDYRRTYVADKTLAAKGIIDQMTPGDAEVKRLEGFTVTLKEALATGQAPSGTEATLKRITDLLKVGGTDAYNFSRAAKDALDQAGMLPFQRGRAQIESQYRERIAGAGNNRRLIEAAEAERRDLDAAFLKQNTDVPIRDVKMRIDEQVAALDVQRRSMLATGEVAATYAARQELINEATRNGQTAAERYGGQLDSLAAQLGKVKSAQEDVARARQNVVGGLDEQRSGLTGLMTGAFSDIRQKRDPMQGIINSLGRMTDQFAERTVFRPITDMLLGKQGDPGGGMFGNVLGGAFTGGVTTPSMAVNAASVTIAGLGSLTGGLPGLGGGVGAVPGGSAAAAGPGGILGALTAPFDAARKLVTDGAGRVVSFSRGIGAGDGSTGGLPITVKPFRFGDDLTLGDRGTDLGALPYRSRPDLSASGSGGFGIGDSLVPPSVRNDIWARILDAGNRPQARSLVPGGELVPSHIDTSGISGIGSSSLTKVGGRLGEDIPGALNAVPRALESVSVAAEGAAGQIGGLGNASIDVAGKLVNSIGGALGGGGSGAGGGGLLGSLLGSIFGGGAPAAAAPPMADGGFLKGIGGPRSDNLLIRASPGEYVINAAATARHRGLLDEINYGGLPGYADGGFVPSPGGEFGESAGFGEVLQ